MRGCGRKTFFMSSLWHLWDEKNDKLLIELRTVLDKLPYSTCHIQPSAFNPGAKKTKIHVLWEIIMNEMFSLYNVVIRIRNTIVHFGKGNQNLIIYRCEHNIRSLLFIALVPYHLKLMFTISWYTKILMICTI